MSRTNVIPFNPLDKKNLGASVAEAMLEQPARPLNDISSFFGVGIYAIYYTGPFDAYAPLTERNRDGLFTAPIYVGKAIPSGARKGGGVGESVDSRALSSRLRDHVKSITEARNLNLDDFFCRYLIVDDIWIPLGESLLIAKFTPLWNAVVDGFGNHDPGKGRHNGLCPKWDVLHPGRPWAEKCAQRPESAIDIEGEVNEFFRAIAFPASHHILAPSQQPPT